MPNDERVAMLEHNVVNVIKGRDHKNRRILIVNCGKSWDPSAVSADQNISSVVFGSPTCHVGTANSDIRNCRHNGFRRPKYETSDGHDTIFLYETLDVYSGSYASAFERGTLRKTTVPIQHGVADVQALREGKAKETYVLPRQ